MADKNNVPQKSTPKKSDMRDEVIALQTDLLRQLTESNLRRVGNDLWGGGAPSLDSIYGASSNTDVKDGASANTDVKDGADANADKKNTPPTATSSGAPVKPAETEAEPPVPIEELREELKSYIGLDSIKDEVSDLINIATVYKLRREHELPTVDMSLHMVFAGNPGTGKTMIARLMAKIYHSLGIISKGQLVEVDRSGLVAGYVGQTAIKTNKVIEAATGGVLFIDEAYSLSTKSENDFGQEAIETLLKAMEDKRDDLIVIVAGYTDKMRGFIESNPGLRSRFNRYLYFEDYTPSEMLDIYEMRAGKSKYVTEDAAKEVLKSYFLLMAIDAASFGNARGVRNVFEKVLVEQANRLASIKEVTSEQLCCITEEDVRLALYGVIDKSDGEKAADGKETTEVTVKPDETEQQNSVKPDETEQQNSVKPDEADVKSDETSDTEKTE